MRKQAAMVIMSFRPTNLEKRAGATAPKNAPALRRATMLEDESAAFWALVENWNSLEKLKNCQ
jgi:hypothetical protein